VIVPTQVILPRVDMDMAQGRISRWYVEEGAKVAKGQAIFEIETDKAAMEVEAPASGVIRGLSASLDVPLPVGSVIAWIDAEGETGAPAASPVAAPGEAQGPVNRVGHAGRAAASAVPDREATVVAFAGTAPRTPLRATPLARRLARESGVDLISVPGSGPKGRVQAADIEKARCEAKCAAEGQAARAKHPRGPLHCEWLRRGEGEPLVLLHGFGGDLNAWRLFLASARPGSPVLGIDLPGHGGSAARRITSFDGMVADVAATLRAECGRPVHLAGHSLGGAVATALASREGFEARSLFLVAPAGLGPQISGAFLSGFLRARTKASLAPWIAQLTHDPAALGSSFVEASLRQRAGAQKALDEVASILFPDGTQAFSIRSAFERLTIPVKIVFGAEDRIIPAHHAFGLPGQVAVHAFPGLGHMPHLEAPRVVARLLNELMRSASAG
jgi:pimeloyl-ACP methyl ester carboxylesterase